MKKYIFLLSAIFFPLFCLQQTADVSLEGLYADIEREIYSECSQVEWDLSNSQRVRDFANKVSSLSPDEKRKLMLEVARKDFRYYYWYNERFFLAGIIIAGGDPDTNLTYKGRVAETFLVRAVTKNDLNAAKLALAYKASTRIPTHFGQPGYLLNIAHTPAMIELLLKNGADWPFKNNPAGGKYTELAEPQLLKQYKLLAAVMYPDEDPRKLKLYQQYGFNLGAKGFHGETPFHYLCGWVPYRNKGGQKSFLEKLTILFESGAADPHLPDNSGITPLAIIEQKLKDHPGNQEIAKVKRLLEGLAAGSSVEELLKS